MFPILSFVLETCNLKDFISLAALENLVQKLATIRVKHYHRVSSMLHFILAQDATFRKNTVLLSCFCSARL